MLTPSQIIARDKIVKSVLANNQAKFENNLFKKNDNSSVTSNQSMKKSNFSDVKGFLDEYLTRINENESKKKTLKLNESRIWSIFAENVVQNTKSSRKYIKKLCKQHNITL